jgi:hypothetical protein
LKMRFFFEIPQTYDRIDQKRTFEEFQRKISFSKWFLKLP